VVPLEGSLHVKIYGDEEGMEQYSGFSGASAFIEFNPSILGAKAKRITLQYLQEGEMTVLIRSVSLVRNDGTHEECMPSVFWGCEARLIISES